MMEIVVLGCLGGILALQGWTLYRFYSTQDKFSTDLDQILDNAEDLEQNLNSLAPILQGIIERIDGGMELMERVPENPLAPILQNGLGMLVQRWIDNTTTSTPGSWQDAEQRNEPPAGLPESTS